MFDKLYAIQYPSGSFGYFVHLLLSEYGKKFNRLSPIVNFDITTKSGNSHFTCSEIKKYYNFVDYNNYATSELLQEYINITSSGNYTTVIVDSGMNNDSTEFLYFFPGTNYLRVCYDDISWPFSAKAFYTRCMSGVTKSEINIEMFVFPEADSWELNEPWEHREKYFLFLRDHEFRVMWRPNQLATTIDIDSFFNYNTLYDSLSQTVELKEFSNLYNDFRKSNSIHIDWYLQCRNVINAIQNKQNIDLSCIDDLFSQATINYYIQILYNFEIPSWDYRNWFTSTSEIFSMFEKYKISY